jgi:hypothetical protein
MNQLTSQSQAVLDSIRAHDDAQNRRYYLERQNFWVSRAVDWQSAGNADNAQKCFVRADSYRALYLRML